MKSKYKFLIVLKMIFIFTSGSLAQGYLSKFVPLDFLPNTMHFFYEDGKYIVSSINFINNISTSTIIELDQNFDTIRTINHPNVLFGRKSPQKYNERYYTYAADETTNRQTHLLIEMDENFQEIKRDSFYPDGNSHNANGMTMIGDKIIGGAWDYYNCEELNECTFMNYKVISTEGEELQSFNVDEEGEPYFFSFEVDHTAEGDILCGGNRYELPYAKGSVYRSTQEGSILWKYDSPHRQSRGNVPVWVEELSNGTIVYTDKLDKLDDDDYLDLGYTNRPSELVWLSPDGDFLFSYLDTVNWTSSTEFYGIEKGKGDYFFTYGEYHLGNLEPTEFDGNYGFIMKVKNNGEIVWRRLYNNSQDLESTPIITHLLEHENGDIAITGVEASNLGYFLWVMRVNENGCMGDEDCDEPLLLTTNEIPNSELHSLIAVFPNPTNDGITLSSTSDHKIEGFSLYDLYGQIKISQDSYQLEEKIDLSDFPNGFYFLQVHLKDHQKIVRRIVKH